MKALSTLIFVFLAAFVVAQTPPAKEFSIQLTENNLNVKPGDKGQVTVTILRSKSFSNGSVKLASSTILPEGITLQFEPSEGKFDSSVATLAVAPSVAPGAYNVIISGNIHNKTKGTILKLMVGNDLTVSK